MKPLLFLFTLLTGSLLAQPLDSLNSKSQRIELQSVDLIQVRASKRSPMAVTRLDAASIKAADNGQGLPFVLQFQPSLLQSSDAGNGMGYTYLRMRGMDQTRINVTINGVALNDPEGHGVFWVNTPDLTSSLNSIQIQRGVGTSTAGPGAFGGSLSLEVGQPDKEASQSITLGGGSFLSARTTYAWQSGEMPQGKGSLRFMGRMSHMQSEGFVDRSSSKLNSYLFAMAYREGNQSIRYVHFNGHEVSQQAWWGIPMVKWRGDQAGVEAYILNNYLANDAADHLRESGNTTYNHYRYPNEIDNYRQSHHQLIATMALDNDWTLNMTNYLVTGKGYFEQWKTNQDYAAYGLANPIVEGNAVTSTNLVRQRWLDNLSVGTNISLSKQVGDWKAVMGYAGQGFIGDHYGTLPWMAINPLQGLDAMDYRYYESYGDKTDNMAFIKVEIPMFDGDWLAYGDLQLRHISYVIYGLDADRVDLNNMDSKRFTFFNPKVGMDRQWANNSRSYLSMAVANREPTRGDFIASMQLEEP
ncbi:MAG: TonB-dependent receptor, partial [Schleiferiaceae bacterium]|nr:TonB-dependent receptor [Schleiferiaceae bacterium]